MTNKSLASFIFVLLMSFVSIAKPADSLRVEMRGGKKFIIHRVIKGETLAGIAAVYGLEEADITNSNALITAGVFTGQIIKLPVNELKYGNIDVKPIMALTDSRMPLAKTLPAPAPAKAIAQQSAVVDTQAINKAIVIETPESKKEEIVIKDTLFPKLVAVPQSVKPSRKITSKFQVYVVASPQTVKQLAINFDVDVDDLIAVNNLKNYRLKEGQKVKIPIYENLGAIATLPVIKPVEPIVSKTEVPKPVTPPVVRNYPPVVRNPPVINNYDSVLVQDTSLTVKVEPAIINPEIIKPVEPIAMKKNVPEKEVSAPLIAIPNVKTQPVKTVTVKVPEPIEPVVAIDTTYMIDTSFHSGKSLAMLSGFSDEAINKYDSAYIHPDNVYYKINDYKRQDYFYDAWAIKAANANAVNVNTTNQRQGAGDKNFFHTVKEGETIQSIAKKYKIGVSDLVNWNGLNQYRVRVGQDLTVNAARADMDEYERANIKENDKQNGTIIKEEVKVGLAFYNPKIPLRGIYCNDVQKGKIIYILNRENFIEYYGRVVGPLPKNVPANTIIQIDTEVAKKLQISNPTINIEIWYGIIE